ncbi:hypothetical protein MAR_035193 [Mya arenaria]|uniref:Uncharacterized protein n=1 Tax=Mya arenaria TaxID=6604 RepID=A0ABY7EJE5_MYAAR|nr:hypothetical protein MAR_035193 [Mya arenaria]
MWSEWTTWSHCTGQCQGGYNTRHQSRSRIRACNVDDPQSQLCQGDKSQQETRPCSAVELHGCLNERTTNVSGDNVYGVVYNFMDEMAMATCAAIVNTSYVIAAVRRNCYSNHAPLCTDICQNLPNTDPTHRYS